MGRPNVDTTDDVNQKKFMLTSRTMTPYNSWQFAYFLEILGANDHGFVLFARYERITDSCPTS